MAIYRVEDFLCREDRIVEAPRLVHTYSTNRDQLYSGRIITYSALTHDGYAACSFSLIVASAHHHVAYIWLV